MVRNEEKHHQADEGVIGELSEQGRRDYKNKELIEA